MKIDGIERYNRIDPYYAIDRINNNKVSDSYNKTENVNKESLTSNNTEKVSDNKRSEDIEQYGVKNDLENMNLVKARNQMKEDSVLDRYKFFVSSSNLGRDDDGVVRLVNRK